VEGTGERVARSPWWVASKSSSPVGVALKSVGGTSILSYQYAHDFYKRGSEQGTEIINPALTIEEPG
jgi:hypothetical protein